MELIPQPIENVNMTIRRGKDIEVSFTAQQKVSGVWQVLDLTDYHVKIVIKEGSEDDSTTILTMADDDDNAYITITGGDVQNNITVLVPNTVTATLARNPKAYLECEFTKPSGIKYAYFTGTATIIGDLI